MGTGNIVHCREEKNQRFLKGSTRRDVQKRLQHDIASNIHRKLYAFADEDKLECGNLDDVKNLKVYQQAKLEVNYKTRYFSWSLQASRHTDIPTACRRFSTHRQHFGGSCQHHVGKKFPTCRHGVGGKSLIC